LFKYIEEHKVYFVYTPLVIYWVILLILTSLPSGIAVTVDVSDKVNHFGAYGLLSVLLFLTMNFQMKYPFLKKNANWLTVLIASSYGVLDELHQMLVPGRSCEFLDWLADFSGSLLGVLIIQWLLKKYYYLSFQKK
jgi:VanZ family protein